MISTIALLTAAAMATVALGDSSHCDPSYECKYYFEDKNHLWSWDFSPLCNPKQYTVQIKGVNALPNLTYAFNICGTTTTACYKSSFVNPYPRGVAVQTWNWAPPCPPAAKNCQDPQGNNQCCSPDCDVLGLGEPTFDVIDTSNVQYGGLNITHRSVPADDQDPTECPYDPKTGGFESRSVTFMMQCDKHGKTGQLTVLDVIESPQCQYGIKIKSKHGCASTYKGAGSAASAGGLVAGMFFLGAFLALGGLAGLFYYRTKVQKDATFFGILGGSGASYSAFGSAGNTGGSTAYGGASSSGGATAYSAVGS